ncbi:MAG: hypothetical protein O2782_20675 [bacterium]|nr:hypothetical protein [bacterium]
MTLKLGDTAPDIALATADGEPMTLRDALLDQRALLMIFLRHLG